MPAQKQRKRHAQREERNWQELSKKEKEKREERKREGRKRQKKKWKGRTRRKIIRNWSNRNRRVSCDRRRFAK